MTPAAAAFEVLQFARNKNKQIHTWLQSLAVICIIAGYVIIYDCHTVLTDHGLALSTHSIVGYITILMGFTEKANGFVDQTLIFAQVIIGLVVATSISVSFSIMKFVDKKDGFNYKPIPHPEES